MLRLFAVIMAGFLVLATGAAAYAALQACALRIGFLEELSGCPTENALALEAELEALALRRSALRTEVAYRERVLAGRQCQAALPSLTAPLTQEELAAGDLEALYGCWTLGSSYQTRDVDTGKVISYPVWRMCFDTHGRGKQVMEGDDGSTCEGPITARIDAGTRLVLGEGGNLACSDGGFIHRRDIACTALGAGVNCATVQPETDGQATVPFARWQ